MELYTAGTGNGQRAAIAVNECGVPCKIHVLNLGQGDQKATDYLKINPTARIPTLIDPDGPGGKPLTVTAILGDPDVSLRKGWQVPAGGPGSSGTDVPVDGRRRRRLRADQSEHLLPRRPHAGKGAGFGDQVLRGPLRQSVALCRRAACQDAISSWRRNHRRRSGGLPNLCRPQGAPRQRRSEASASLGRADWFAARRAEGYEARKLTADLEQVLGSRARIA